MPSHLDIEDLDWLPSDITAVDLKGNEVADKQAVKAAENHLVNLNASSHYLWYINLAARIQRRLVVIMCSLEARSRQNNEIEDPSSKILTKSPPIENYFPFSSHVLLHNGNCIMCARCNQSYPRDHEYIRKWLTSDCPMLNSSIDKPRPMPLGFLHVGSKSV